MRKVTMTGTAAPPSSESSLGAVVTEEFVGEVVGKTVGDFVVGEIVVGEFVVGEFVVGEFVGKFVGEIVGDSVGADDVGDVEGARVNWSWNLFLHLVQISLAGVSWALA